MWPARQSSSGLDGERHRICRWGRGGLVIPDKGRWCLLAAGFRTSADGLISDAHLLWPRWHGLERLPAVRPILRLPSPLTTEGHPGRPTQLQAIQQLASGAVLVSVFLSRRRPTEVGQCSSGRICTRRRIGGHGKGPYPHRRGSQIKRSRWSLRLPRMVGRLHDIRDAVVIRSSWARWTEEDIGAPAIRSQLDELGWQA